MPDITTASENGILKVYLRDVRLSEDSLVEAVGAELNTLVNQFEGRNVILDFRDVNFMNSSMIGKLVQLNKRCKQEDIDLRLCGMNANLLEVFDLMQLPKIMKIHPDEQAAIAAIAG